MNTIKSFISFVAAGIVGSLMGKGLVNITDEVKKFVKEKQDKELKNIEDALKWRAHVEATSPYMVTIRNGEIYQLRNINDARSHLMETFGKDLTEKFLDYRTVDELCDPIEGYKYTLLNRSEISEDKILETPKIRELAERIAALKSAIRKEYDSKLWFIAKDLAKEAVELFYSKEENKDYRIVMVYKLTPNLFFDLVRPSLYNTVDPQD